MLNCSSSCMDKEDFAMVVGTIGWGGGLGPVHRTEKMADLPSYYGGCGLHSLPGAVVNSSSVDGLLSLPPASEAI